MNGSYVAGQPVIALDVLIGRGEVGSVVLIASVIIVHSATRSCVCPQANALTTGQKLRKQSGETQLLTIIPIKKQDTD